MTPEQLLKTFDELVKKERLILQSKSHDYSGDTDVLKNLQSCEKFEIVDSAARGVMLRLSDKFMRLVSFLNQGELKVKDESIMDTISDARNYLMFLGILMTKEKTKKLDSSSDFAGLKARSSDLAGVGLCQKISGEERFSSLLSDYLATDGVITNTDLDLDTIRKEIIDILHKSINSY